jgi:hypothetical protein
MVGWGVVLIARAKVRRKVDVHVQDHARREIWAWLSDWREHPLYLSCAFLRKCGHGIFVSAGKRSCHAIMCMILASGGMRSLLLKARLCGLGWDECGREMAGTITTKRMLNGRKVSFF